MNLGLPEMIVLFCVALLVFGPKRLPELAKNVGKGVRDFKRAMSGLDEEEEEKKKEQPPPTLSAPESGEPAIYGVEEKEKQEKLS